MNIKKYINYIDEVIDFNEKIRKVMLQLKTNHPFPTNINNSNFKHIK